jgi:hypothetical protein
MEVADLAHEGLVMSDEMTAAEYEATMQRWLADYRPRADIVRAELSALLLAAQQRWQYDDATSHLDILPSRLFLREQRAVFPHPIVLFLYSSQFDGDVEAEVLDSDALRVPFAHGPSPEEILSRKAAMLEGNFRALALCADLQAGHYTVALSSNEKLHELPLVWEVPTLDEGETGVPHDAMWQTTFVFLCEMAHAIVAYGGYSSHFFDELTYINRDPHLRPRLLWMDQERQLMFPDDVERGVERAWPIGAIEEALAVIP